MKENITSANTPASVHLNGIEYAWPERPVVVVCIDGGDSSYIDHGIKEGLLPHIAQFIQQGFASVAEGTVPSFTCPNNMSLITGAPPAVHGISGNFYLDTRTGEAVVMTGPELLRSRTLLAEFADAGARVVSITAKDKLCKQLGKDLDLSKGNINFSAERATQCTLAENGIENVLELTGMPQPHMYSMDLSLFVMEAGIRLLAREKPQIMYLSLTDYIQHKHAPGDPVANLFYQRLDDCIGRLAAMGAIVALTADHGMNDKSRPDGEPNVIFLQDVLDEKFGTGTTRVICPITDAFVKHHGALGGFVRIWCLDPELEPARVMDHISGLDGIAEVLDRNSVCARYQLPPDREGDVAVIATTHAVIGASAADHDLSELKDARLRSHGGTTEARVPFIINTPMNHTYQNRAAAGLKSHQIFDFAINGTRSHV